MWKRALAIRSRDFSVRCTWRPVAGGSLNRGLRVVWWLGSPCLPLVPVTAGLGRNKGLDPRHGRTNDDRWLSSLEHSGNFRIPEQKEEPPSLPAPWQEEGVHVGQELSEVKERRSSYSPSWGIHLLESRHAFEYKTKSCVFLSREIVNSYTGAAFKVCGHWRVRQFTVIWKNWTCLGWGLGYKPCGSERNWAGQGLQENWGGR